MYAKVITGQVGHFTISTTMDIYGHLMADTQRDAAVKFEQGLALTAPETASKAP